MDKTPLKAKPFSYSLYLESLKKNVDWKDWAKRVKEYQETKKKQFP